MAEFLPIRYRQRISVRVPATSANVGPGFDSFGLALGMYDEVTVEAFPSHGELEVDVHVAGVGAGTVPLTAEHLVVRAMLAGFRRAGVHPPGLHVWCRNAIPQGRGLGSSAAAIVAGLVAAQALLREPESFDDAAVFAVATELEGHPDNAAAAFFGGFTVAWSEPAAEPGTDGDAAQVGVVRCEIDPIIQPVVCVPNIEVLTTVARSLLPETVPHADAAFTAARSALLLHALTRDPQMLLSATSDRLHQPYRAPAMPYSLQLVQALRARQQPAVVSGAGPSVLILGNEGSEKVVRAVIDELAAAGDPANVTDAQSPTWQVYTPNFDAHGAVVTRHQD